MKEKDELIEEAYKIMEKIKAGYVYNIDLNVLNLIKNMIQRIERLKSENKNGEKNESATESTD